MLFDVPSIKLMCAACLVSALCWKGSSDTRSRGCAVHARRPFIPVISVLSGLSADGLKRICVLTARIVLFTTPGLWSSAAHRVRYAKPSL